MATVLQDEESGEYEPFAVVRCITSKVLTGVVLPLHLPLSQVSYWISNSTFLLENFKLPFMYQTDPMPPAWGVNYASETLILSFIAVTHTYPRLGSLDSHFKCTIEFVNKHFLGCFISKAFSRC